MKSNISMIRYFNDQIIRWSMIDDQMIRSMIDESDDHESDHDQIFQWNQIQITELIQTFAAESIWQCVGIDEQWITYWQVLVK